MASKKIATSDELVAKGIDETTIASYVSESHSTTNGAGFDNDFDKLNEQLSNSMTTADELQAAEAEAAAEALRFKPLTFGELLSRPPKEWIVDQVFGTGDLVMLYGPPGSGKTFVLIDLVFAASLGRDFARRFDVAKPLNVAYCAGEGIGGLSQRFAAAAAAYQTEALPGFAFYENVPQLFSDDGDTMDRFIVEQLARQEQGGQAIDLLVIDTLHSATVGAEENSAKDMGVVRDRCLHAARALGCAVLLAHHTNKAGNGERGSSSLRGAMDCMIELKEFGQKYAMHCAKLKDGEQWKPQPFDLITPDIDIESVRVWWDEPGEIDDASAKGKQHKQQITDILSKQPGVRMTARALGEAVGLGTSKQIYKILSALVRDEEQIVSGLKDASKDSSPHNPLMYWYEVGQNE